MPSDGLYPAFVKIDYHSDFGIHSHTIPLKAITTAGLGDPGTITSHNGDPVPADVMVETLMDKLAEAVPSTTVYDRYTIYDASNPDVPPRPVYTEAYPVTGSAAGLTGQAKAVQVTISIRTLGFGLLKIVLLDRPNNNTWGNQLTLPADYTEILAELVSPDNGWAGRDNTRPSAFTNVSISLNKRLRRKYGMI